MLSEVNTWLRDHPWQADGLLAAALLAFSMSQLIPGTAGLAEAGYIAVGVLLAGLVVMRRRYPVAAFAVAAAVGAVQVAWGVRPGTAQPPVFALQPSDADAAILILLYTLAAYRPRPVSLTGLAVCLLGAAAAIARWSPAQHAHAGAAIFGAAAGLGGVTLTAWVLGDSVAYRYRRARFAALEERAARLEADGTPRPGSPPPPSGPANWRNGAPGRSMSRPPGCAGSSATCTTAPRSGWPPWP